MNFCDQVEFALPLKLKTNKQLSKKQQTRKQVQTTTTPTATTNIRQTTATAWYNLQEGCTYIFYIFFGEGEEGGSEKGL